MEAGYQHFGGICCLYPKGNHLPDYADDHTMKYQYYWWSTHKHNHSAH